jgi:hypothetical protein
MFIVDRRLNPGSKSLEKRRAKALVQGAVKKTLEGRDIKDVLVATSQSRWYGINHRMTLSSRILQGARLLKARAARNWRWNISNDLLLASLSTASDIWEIGYSPSH